MRRSRWFGKNAAMKATVFCATSLDGYIARSDGDISWLGEPGADEDESGDNGGFTPLMESIDYLVMGRNTYEKVLTFGDWPYAKPVVVLTSRELAVPKHLSGKIETMSGSPADIVATLASRGAKHLYVDGGNTIQRFLRAGLIHNLIVTTVPVLIGSGIPLFSEVDADIQRQHVATRTLTRGLVQSEYVVVR
ncbi:MAG: dihydrofolate reductase family protein [Planctomycetota bacterium]